MLLMAPMATGAAAQTAGTSKLGVTTLELQEVIKGWSVQRQLLGQDVYNDKNERIGEIEDIIISPEKNISYGIVSTGGFLGMGSHDVAIPASQFKMGEDGRLQLTVAGADVRARVHAVRCDELNGLLAGWEPERHAEIRRLVDELARSLATEVPQPAR